MTNQEHISELQTLSERLDKASDKELAQIYMSVAHFDPFVKYKMMLPSVVRKRTIEKIRQMIKEGKIIVSKVKS